MRTFAAVSVFAAHAALLAGNPLAPHLGAIRGQGRTALSFFFVLSGFVLTWGADPQQRAGTFYRRRFARIYPVYLFGMLAGGVVAYTTHDLPVDVSRWVPALLLLQDWIPRDDYHYAINGVAWSLSAEVFFYLTYPFWWRRVLALSRRQRRMLQAGMVLIVLGIATYAHFVVSNDWSSGLLPDTPQSWLAFNSPLARVPEFILGTTLVGEVREGCWKRVNRPVALALFGGAFAFAALFASAYSPVAVTLLPLSLLIIVYARHDAEGGSGWLHDRRLVLIGQASFAFYMVHQLPIRVLRNAEGFVHGPKHLLAYSALLLALATVWAVALFVWLERPLERRLRGARVRPAKELV